MNQVWYNPNVTNEQAMRDGMACEEYAEQRAPDYDEVVEVLVRDDKVDGYTTTCDQTSSRTVECESTPNRNIYAMNKVQKVERRSRWGDRLRIHDQCLMSKGYRKVDRDTLK